MTEAPSWTAIFSDHFWHDLIRPWIWLSAPFGHEFWHTLFASETWEVCR